MCVCRVLYRILSFPQVAKLSRALQTKHLDLSLISGLVDDTLNSLDNAYYFIKLGFTATRCKRRVKSSNRY